MKHIQQGYYCRKHMGRYIDHMSLINKIMKWMSNWENSAYIGSKPDTEQQKYMIDYIKQKVRHIWYKLLVKNMICKGYYIADMQS